MVNVHVILNFKEAGASGWDSEKKLGWITRKRFETIARAKKTEALYIVIGNLHWKTFISYQYVIIIITNIRRVEQAIHILYRHPYNVVLFAKWIKKITQVELAVLNKWYCRICAKKFHLLFSYLYLLEHWITNRTPFWSYTKTYNLIRWTKTKNA